MKYFKMVIKKILSLLNFRLIKINTSTSLIVPIEADKEIIKFIDISSKYSMSGHHRMYLLSQAILNAKEKRLEGDFVECGVWKGGIYYYINY
jgi:O-methyltransferase